MGLILDGNDLWSPPPMEAVAPRPDAADFAIWLVRSLGDPAWNPDRASDQAMEDWQAEMARLISIFQRTRATSDARRAAIHHAKLMHRHLLNLGYPTSAERDVKTFIWWMAHREAWLNETSVVA